MKFSDEEDYLCNSESNDDMEVDVVAPWPRSCRTKRAKAKPVTHDIVDNDDSFVADSDDDSDFWSECKDTSSFMG